MSRVDVPEVVAREKGVEPAALPTRVRQRLQTRVPRSPRDVGRSYLSPPKTLPKVEAAADEAADEAAAYESAGQGLPRPGGEKVCRLSISARLRCRGIRARLRCRDISARR